MLTLCSGRGGGGGGVGEGVLPFCGLYRNIPFGMLCTLSELKVSIVNPRPYFLRGKEHISLAGSQQIELSGSLSVDFGYACQKISESVLPLIPPPHFCLCECVFISGQFQIFDKGLSIKSKKKFFKNISTSIAT